MANRYMVIVPSTDYSVLEVEAETEEDALDWASALETADPETFYDRLVSGDSFEYHLDRMSVEAQ